MDKKQIKELCRGRSKDQKKVIRYFADDTGCLGLFGVSDQDFDLMVEEKTEPIGYKNRAIQKLGIDEDEVQEVPPLLLIGPKRDDSKPYPCRKLAADGHYRYTCYTVSWVFCSAEQLYVYSYEVHLDSDEKRETADEYFIKDINNITTQEEIEEFMGGQLLGCLGGQKITPEQMKELNLGCLARETRETETFHYLQIKVPGDRMLLPMKPEDVEVVESTIQAIKSKIRETRTRGA